MRTWWAFALAVVVLVGCSSNTGELDGAPPPTHGSSPTSRPLPPQPHRPSELALIYAAALRGRPPGPVELRHTVYLASRFCQGMIEIGRRGPCESGPIPWDVRRDLVRLLGPKLRISDHPPVPIPRKLQGKVAIVRLGSARIRGPHAEVPIDFYCGPLCGSGETLKISKRGSSWAVTGTGGIDWIS